LGRFATKTPTLGRPLAGSGAALGACALRSETASAARSPKKVLLTLTAFGFACRHPIHFLRRLRQPASELIGGRGTNSLLPRRPGVLSTLANVDSDTMPGWGQIDPVE
jgi:hypothetical protein